MKPLSDVTRKHIAERLETIQAGLRNLGLMIENVADEIVVFKEIIGDEIDDKME